MSRSRSKTDNAPWFTWRKYRKMLAYGARRHERPGDVTLIKKVERQNAKREIQQQELDSMREEIQLLKHFEQVGLEFEKFIGAKIQFGQQAIVWSKLMNDLGIQGVSFGFESECDGTLIPVIDTKDSYHPIIISFRDFPNQCFQFSIEGRTVNIETAEELKTFLQEWA